MLTFNNYIDEFVDWVTGEDTSNQESEQKTRVSSTGGLPVSGGSIRELLQTRLKKPFVTYEDKNAGLYRMFSSESTRDKWIRMNTPESPDYDPDNSSYLELFNFVRPSDVVISINGIDTNPKYIINGDSESSAAKISFYVKMDQGGSPASDSFTVTYTVIDSNGVEHIAVEERGESYSQGSQAVTRNIYSMLTVGKNEVSVRIKARSSSAGATISFPVYLIDFELLSSFKFYQHWPPGKENQIEIPVSIKRSDDSLTLQVDVYVDGGSPVKTWTINNGGTNPTNTFRLDNIYASNEQASDHIKHLLKIEAKMYDLDSGITYYSNVLFFDFVVASTTVGGVNKFVNIKYSVPYSKVSTNENGYPILQLTQYEPFTLPWAYYTEALTTDQAVNIQWAIRTGIEEYTYAPIGGSNGINNALSEDFKFIPDFYTEDSNTYLVAMYNDKEIDKFPITSSKSSLSIVEIGGYDLKLQAYGKTNQAADRDQWTDNINNVTTTFTGISFDTNSGWNNNSFVTSGINSYAEIHYIPLPQTLDLARNGKTIEIDFKPERVINDDDVLILIGDPDRGNIKITTNQAGLYNGNNEILHTNYKSNERIKLAFVFNPVIAGSVDSNLVYIINDGILERAASYGTAASFLSNVGVFKIGGVASGVRVYNIRCYNKALTTDEELSNYIYDSDNKAEILSNNDIFSASIIDYNKVKNKIDTVLLTGDLSRILSLASDKEGSESTITFNRECITDATKSFEVVNGMIRKHGQSTLNYPITSMKIWTNKSSSPNILPSITLSEVQKAEGLAKNRYIMKNGAIPANKFVLQANYADSSGVHNGGLLRLIHDTWYNAIVDGKYVLRTAPQLFSSGEILVHNDAKLNEDGSWIEGRGVGIAAGKTWKDISSRPFPYEIRNAADSFPCAVFYKNGPDDGYHFLGQYVFMDDKKSDYIYGERSIYYHHNGQDPFVLKVENTKNGANGKQDTSENCVWDNKNVLRIEVVLPNYRLSSYMDFYVEDGGVQHLPTDIKKDANGNNEKYYWEDIFEIIYPDEDDIAADDAADGLTKFDQNSKFVKKATPFINFLKWITDCNRNYNKATDWWSAGQYSTRQQAFEATASQHLDLYKVAAYYIFFLRFGLVDSVERNAQLKTYDGQHWHYEPWDMDIALGNTNQGALVLNPPLTRDSFEPGTTTYAYSGKTLTTSNVLWDCLEAWDYWANTVVPKVAQALYMAGLSYDNVIRMFDDEYANAWSETMYNQSGHFKYIESGGSGWLAWLQGARTSHRHWWISTSMNYYDAKWSCGSFNDYRVSFFADKEGHSIGTDIVTIKPSSETFFKMTQQDGAASLGTIEASPTKPAVFDVSSNIFSAKDPSHIYGATFIEEINMSCFAAKLKGIDFSLCYDKVLGSSLKKVYLNIPFTTTSSTRCTGLISGTELRITAYDANTGNDAFDTLQLLDICGQGNLGSANDLLSANNRNNITDFYAIGTNITAFESAASGNKFNLLKLPAVTTTTFKSGSPVVTNLATFTMHNSSWNDIEFWNTEKPGDLTQATDEDGSPATDADGNPVYEPSLATHTKVSVPSSITTVIFDGSTAANECAGKFILDWIASIEADLRSTKPSYTEDDLYKELQKRSLNAENINWGTPNQSLRISYKDIARIAQFNNANNSGGTIKGYIMLSDKSEFTAEQLANLTMWFGPSVFSKGSQNSNLVIDQELSYTRITFTNAEMIDGKISLREGNRTGVNATKFTLSESNNTNYEWRLSANNPNNGSLITGTTALSCKIERGEDNLMYLIASENGTFDDGKGGYDLTVSVFIDGIELKLTIRIIAAKLPSQMTISNVAVNSNPIRRFYVDDTIGRLSSVFSSNVRESYVMTEVGQQVEFYPTFSQTPGFGDYASLKEVRISVNDSAAMTSDQLTGQEDSILNRVNIPGEAGMYMYYTKSAKNGGIVLGLLNVSEDMKIVKLQISAVIGEKIYMSTINVVIYNDSMPMHNTTNGQYGVHNALCEMFNNIYGQGIMNNASNFYKTDLFSLHGSLNFSGYSSLISTVYTLNNEPLIKYLINATELIFDGCANTNPTAPYFGTLMGTTLTFCSLPNLTKLSFNGCYNSSTNILDLTYCTAIKELDLRGTQTGIRIVNGSVETLRLGSPKTILIINPKVLTSSGVTIENNLNIDNVLLQNVNVGDASLYITSSMHGYNIFDKLYL